MYTLVVTPNPILINKAQPVRSFDEKLHQIILEMQETLLATTDPVGVGLAAPQVGLPLFIFQMKPTEKSSVTTYINPVILESTKDIPTAKITQKKKKGKLLEGCLSVPNIWGHVTRKKEVKLSWQNELGKTKEKVFKGFSAVIVQHEMDHLHGILFTKHVIEQNEKLYKSHKNEQGEDEFDEIKI